jgi:hypothetical protein
MVNNANNTAKSHVGKCRRAVSEMTVGLGLDLNAGRRMKLPHFIKCQVTSARHFSKWIEACKTKFPSSDFHCPEPA